MKRRSIIICAMALASATVFAQEVDRTPKISGFAQVRYTADFDNDSEVKDNSFSLQRVRLSVEGNLTKDLTYKYQGDLSRSPAVVDAFLKYKISNILSVQAGQFKVPFTIESLINPVNLEINDYGTGIKRLSGYNDVCGVGAMGRDLGIMLSGSFSIIDYKVGVFNGNGIKADNNNQKDFSGRLDVHPIENMMLSGSLYLGEYDNGTVKGRRNRWSAGAQYDDGSLIVRSEYIGGVTGSVRDDASKYDKKSNSLYAVAGYRFNIGKEQSQKLIPVVRFERFEEDESISKGAVDYYTVGLLYEPVKQLNIKLNYQLVRPESGDNVSNIVAMVNFRF